MKFAHKISLFILFLASSTTMASTVIPAQLSFGIGSFSGSFKENADNLKSTDGTTSTASTPYSGTATSMPLEISYEYFSTLKRSWVFKGSGPVMGSTPDRYFNASAGINFYFNKVGAEAKVSDFNFELKIIPKMRYYAGPTMGVGYLVYNTKSATKSDVLLELGGQGGIIYTINQKWGLKGEVGLARAIGVLVSSTVIKITIGFTNNLAL